MYQGKGKGKGATSKSAILIAKDFISCISFNLFVTAAISVTYMKRIMSAYSMGQ